MSSDAKAALAPVLTSLLRPRLGYAIDPWPQPLWDRLEALARAQGAPPALLLARADDALVTQLLAAATITHTQFFRHPEQFAQLERELRGCRGRTVRMLCAGCSRGEEVYSLALTAERAGVQFEIDAVDINADAIAFAERGSYDAIAARGVPGADAVRGWTAPASLRERIRFRRSSLVEGLSNRNLVYDYVFCRNVLIYFTPESALDMLRLLLARVAPGGALVVAPTEALARLPTGLERAAPLGWLIRESPALKPTAAAPTPASSSFEPEVQLELTLHGDADETDLIEWLEARPDDAVAWFLLAEKLVGRGEYAQANTAYTHVIAHAARATLVDPDTLRAAAQRRLRGSRKSGGSQ